MAKAKTKRRAEEETFDFEILEATDFNPGEASCGVVAGPPGAGKSTLLGQMCVEGPTLLLATLQREASSWMYQRHNPDVILLEDSQWKPLPPDDVKDKRGEPYKVILLDSGTEAGENAWHQALMPFAVMDTAYMEAGDDGFRPYTALDGLMDRLIKALQALKSAPLPKHVGISWHVQPSKEDSPVKVQGGGYKTKESADHKGEGVEYEGSILPMIRGRFRRRLFGLVDYFIWADIDHVKNKTRSVGGKTIKPKSKTSPEYVLQVLSDEERHCKLPGELPPEMYIPNSWPDFKELLLTESEEEE